LSSIVGQSTSVNSGELSPIILIPSSLMLQAALYLNQSMTKSKKKSTNPFGKCGFRLGGQQIY